MNKWMFVFISIVLSLYLTSAGWAAQCGPVYGADGIEVDSNGDVWLTHYEDVRIGRLNPEKNEFAEFLPTTKSDTEVTTRKKGSSKEGFDYSFDTGFSGIGMDEKRGFLWTSKWNSNKIVRFSLKDKGFKEFTVPGYPHSKGSMDFNGNLWVLTSVPKEDLMPKDGKVLKVSPQGKILKEIPAPHNEFTAYSMTLDNQGRVWLAQTPIGKGKEAELYVLNPPSPPFAKGGKKGGLWQRLKLPDVGGLISSMAFDSKGNLWFAAYEKNVIGKISPLTPTLSPKGRGDSGVNLSPKGQGGLSEKVTLYTIPTPKSSPGNILIDSNDNIWFTEFAGLKIARLSQDGEFKEYPLPPEEEWVVTLAFDRDGEIWFSTLMNYNIFRLNPETGAIKEYTVPVPSNWSEDAAAASSVCSVKSKDVKGEEIKADPLTPLRHPVGHPEDQKAVLFEKNCNTQCHTWYRVDKVAQRRTDWTPTVDRMIEANGAKFITEKDREEIIRYLNENYTMRKRETETK